jgi:hypothetical protein
VALKPDDAVKAARNIWAGPRIFEAERLNYIAQAVNPRRAYSSYLNSNQPILSMPGGPTVEMPDDAPQVMKNLAWKSRTNFLPLILDTFSQVTKADGYTDTAGDQSTAWSHWQANGMDARQTGIHRAAMQYGAAYATTLPGDTGPVIHGYSPRRMTAIYQDPEIDDWPFMAIEINGPMVRLFDEECVYYIGAPDHPSPGLGASTGFVTPPAQWEYIEKRTHGLSYCPVVRYRDRMLLDGEEQFGIVEPLIDIQRRQDETQFELLTAQYYTAFQMRYVIGWLPESTPRRSRRRSATSWPSRTTDVKVGQLGRRESRPVHQGEGQRACRHGGHRADRREPTDERRLRAEQRRLRGGRLDHRRPDRKGAEIKTALGESHELMLRSCALIAGDTTAAEDTSSRIRWADMTNTSPGAIVDALGKLQQMLGVPRRCCGSGSPAGPTRTRSRPRSSCAPATRWTS